MAELGSAAVREVTSIRLSRAFFLTLAFLYKKALLLVEKLTVILFSSSSEIRLRIVTNRLGSNIGLSVNSCNPQKYCM